MYRLRFNHFFVASLGLLAAVAFLVPQRLTDKAVPNLQGLFLPVSGPTRWAMGIIERRVAGEEQIVDTRPVDKIRRENDELRQTLVQRDHELAEARRIAGERQGVGLDVWSLCTPVTVVGPDSGNRDSLAIGGSSFSGLRDGMCVLYAGGIVGTLQRSGVAGGQVQLVTNRGFHVTAFFGKFANVDGKPVLERLNKVPVLVEGNGEGIMLCKAKVTYTETQQWQLAPGDWVLLEDSEWSSRVQARRLGKVVSVAKNKEHQLFADILIRPESDLKKLREVMVLTRN